MRKSEVWRETKVWVSWFLLTANLVYLAGVLGGMHEATVCPCGDWPGIMNVPVHWIGLSLAVVLLSGKFLYDALVKQKEVKE